MINRKIAGIISFILPGIGHIIQGRIKKGIIMFIIFLITLLLFIIPGMGIIRLIYMLYSAYDAYKIE
ncbi:MAG: hypothetical protein MJ232_04945 [archaeon]|nr:hypothetical protein [archaeon]